MPVCPECEFQSTHLTLVAGDDARPPSAGDLTLCPECGAMLIFVPVLALARASSADLREADPVCMARLERGTEYIKRKREERRALRN